MLKLLLGLLTIISFSANATQLTHMNHNNNILWISVLAIAAMFSLIASKYRQSTVLAQLLIGAVISIFSHFHIEFFNQLISSQVISFLATAGSIFLLFEIGLESDLAELKISGSHALGVAIIGVVVPFCLGYFLVTPYILHSESHNLKLFVGGILAVTSTSISVSVFKELGIIRLKACQIVLTASVIDDIIGLILLSIISELITSGSVSNHMILSSIFKVVLFFIISYCLYKLLPKLIIPKLASIGQQEQVTILFIVALCFFMSWVASIIGLAPIIGAFVAGLILNYKIFLRYNLLSVKQNHYEHNQALVDLIQPLGKVLTPLFFIFAGMQVDLVSAFSIKTIAIAIAISIFAILGKISCCIMLPKTINKLIVGFGMVPRGEIGIIFAITGLEIGVIDNNLFTALLLVVVITSMFTPIALNKVIRKSTKI